MKRLLATILAVSMLLSCMITPAVAQERTQAAQQSYVIGTSDGWNWNATTALKTQGEASVSKTFEANTSLGIGAVLCYYRPTSGAEIDVSAADTFVFDLYVSDAEAIKNVRGEIEITSSGTCDVEEQHCYEYVNDLVDGGLQNGWNTVVIPLERMYPVGGGADLTRVNFFRQWFEYVTTGEEELTIAYDYLRFTKDGEVVAVLSNCEIGETITPEITEVEGFKELGDAFLADFNKYGECEAMKETFFNDAARSIKTALANADMLAKWNWLWVYMLNHLKATNPDATSAYLTDAYPVLERMISGDTTAILDNANARTTIRSYIHGVLNTMKGCGDLNPDFSPFSPDFSSVDEQTKLVAASKTSAIPGEPEQPSDGAVNILLSDGTWDFFEGSIIEMNDRKMIGNVIDGDRFKVCDIYANYMSETGLDVSAMKYLEYDLYISDAEALKNVILFTEINSSGDYDRNELEIYKTFADYGLKNGWNRIKIDLSMMQSPYGACDLTSIKWFRIYTLEEAALTNGLTYALTNVRFTHDNTPEIALPEAPEAEEPEQQFYSVTVHFKDNANGQTIAPSEKVTGIAAQRITVTAPSVEGYTAVTNQIEVTISVGGGEYTIWYDKNRPSDPVIPVGGPDIPLTGGTWEGFGKAMTMDGVSGIGNTYTSHLLVADIYHAWMTDTPLDISNAKYLEFDLYISNAMAFKYTDFMFELTSSGEPDTEEISFYMSSGWQGLRNGWNHIQWSISDLFTIITSGTFDPSNFNYFRIYNARDIDIGGLELTVMFANVKFTTGGATLATDENGIVTQGKEHFVLTPTREDKTDPSNSPNKNYVVKITAGHNSERFYADGQGEIVYKIPVTHASTARKILLTIKAGGHYWLQAGTDGQTWNDVFKVYDVEMEQNGGMGNKGQLLRATYTFDLTEAVIGADGKMDGKYIYIRLLDAYPAQGWGSNMFYEPAVFEIAYDLNGDPTPEEPTLSGVVVPMEEAYWDQCWLEENFHGMVAQVRTNNASTSGPGGFMFRYNEGGEKAEAVDLTNYSYIEFDVYVSNVDVIAEVEFSFELTSSGIADKEEIAKNFKGKDTGWVNGWNHVKWGLDEFTAKYGEFDPSRWNFIRFFNLTTVNVDDFFEVGIANLHFTQKSAAELDAEEATKTEHSVPMWGANENWNSPQGDWEIDNDNQVAGSGCVSINLNGITGTRVAYKNFDAVNAEGMDSLEFDIYLSDLAIIDYLKNDINFGAIEISSSGTCDQAEKNIIFEALMDLILAGNPVVGWNRVVIPLSAMYETDGSYGPFDLSHVDYIRIYWSSSIDCGQDWILKLDNFCLTDAGQRAETELEKNHSELFVILENLSAYTNVFDITVDNFFYVNEQVLFARGQVDSLTSSEQQLLDAKGFLENLIKAEKALNTYLEILTQNEFWLTLIDDFSQKYAVITEKNYEVASAEISDARFQYECLSARQRQVIENAGYLAKLEAAEAVLAAYEPEESIPEDAPKLKVESVTIHIGGTVDVRLWIENNPGVIAMNLNVEYDSTQLELVAVTDGGLMNVEPIFGDRLSQNPYPLVWEDAVAMENNTANGVLVTFTFKVKDDATVGDVVLNLSYATIINMELEHIDFATIDGVITVVDYISGDVNDDGKVNGLDVATFKRYLANWEGYEEINESAADVNRDGIVDLVDVVVLRRYLAGWDGVELK